MNKEDYINTINKYNINNLIDNNYQLSFNNNYAIIKGKIPLSIANNIHNNGYDIKYKIKINGNNFGTDPIEYATDDIYEKELENISNNQVFISSFIDKFLEIKESLNNRNDNNKYIKMYHIETKEGLDLLLNELNNYFIEDNKKEETVIKYYLLCNKLKNIVRTGWKIWNVKKERLESVAEHIFSAQMLAIAMKSEYNYDIDLMKTILMLSVHELEEIIIGDIPMGSTEHANKEEIGHKAVKEILSPLLNGEQIEKLILEFDEKKTKEAVFAYHCDKLDCDLQEKIYDEQGYIDLFNQPNNDRFSSPFVQRMILDRAKTLSEIWYTIDEHLYNDDDNFKKVFTYARNNNITKLNK